MVVAHGDAGYTLVQQLLVRGRGRFGGRGRSRGRDRDRVRVRVRVGVGLVQRRKVSR